MVSCIKFSLWVLVLVVALDFACSDHEVAHVTLQVVNDVDPNWVPYTTVVTVPAGQSVYKLLLIARETIPGFTFEATYHAQWGHHVTSINNLAADDNVNTFWQLEDMNGLPHVQGIDWVYLHEGDTVVWRYTTYDPTGFDFD
ncbi:Hypp286 [Branchiostoma lanceolatum]|uniref:Hypp286 protein n=1 Tax=Branchiostoma lanceolatum TaxID=7740 RepID=A0A8J9W318_BRALA|nr:Hypp286 [Branchiostoma lanceolatum]